MQIFEFDFSKKMTFHDDLFIFTGKNIFGNCVSDL